MYESYNPGAPAPRKYSPEAKAAGRKLHEMLLNGDQMLTVRDARDACSYCRTLLEMDIKSTVYSPGVMGLEVKDGEPDV